ncbi:HAD family phosphatase [Candidatus Saccharibacteria bacterium]|nr:MAG: HAD family phosphatase [Candidatus Saccharibacteria bacterium]
MSDTLGFQPVGAIFDIDDTLLDNYPKHRNLGLHEYARLLALREIGQKYGITELAETTEEHNKLVIQRAREHSIEGGTWQLFYELGLVKSPVIDHDNALLQEIARRKHELYEPILLEFGAPLPMAVEFVKAVYILMDGKIAIASGAQRADVRVFLRMTELDQLFEARRVITREDFTHAKPNPESFEKAFATLDLPGEDRARVLAFDDDPKGVASAKQAGLYVCGITSRFAPESLRTPEFSPDMVHDGYVDFASALGISL